MGTLGLYTQDPITLVAQLQLSTNCSFTANTPNYLYLLQYLMLSYYHTVLSYEHIDHKIDCRNPQVRGKEELYPDSRHTIIWSSAVNKWITKNRSQKSTSHFLENVLTCSPPHP